MYMDDGKILAWAPSYRLLRTRLVSRYSDCIAWLERAGLTIEGDKPNAILDSLTRASQTPTDFDPAQITVPGGEGTQLTVNCSDNVRYFWDPHYRRGPMYWKDFS
jgi:hypothetical protein